jgi:Plasmid maintenance system killer protein
MDVEFDDEQLERLEADETCTTGVPTGMAGRFRRCMQIIRSAVDERDFFALRSLNFEKLKGKRQHQYSMRLNEQWRLILELRGKGPAKKVAVIAVEDYH